MDGVLIDSEPLWKIAEIEAFAKVGLDLKTTDCEATVGMRIDQVVEMWHKRVGWNNKGTDTPEARIGIGTSEHQKDPSHTRIGDPGFLSVQDPIGPVLDGGALHGRCVAPRTRLRHGKGTEEV